MNNGNGKSIQEIIHEMKNELIEFVATRAAMLSSEMSEKARTWKMAAPSLVIGGVLLLTAWLLFSACLVALVAMAFNPPWNYAIALAIVSVGYLVIGGLIAWIGWKGLKNTSLAPERTIRTLKQDQVWLQTEVKTEL
jgi:uncharacterized membrane protein YqjE